MARKKQTDNQFSFDDYQLKQVDVRLKLMDGPSYYSKTPILNASDAVDVMRDVLKELDREWVCVVNLDNHLKPVNFNVVSIGSINLSLAPVQNILKSGLLSNCNRLILLHNHPSGELTPSDEDNQLTKRVTEAAKLLEMEVLDHVIVGGQTGEIYSFRQDHPELFSMENIDLDYIHQMENAADRGFAEERTAYGTDDKTVPNQAADQDLAEGKALYQPKGKYDPKQAIENRKNEMKEITEKLEQGVANIFSSEKYQIFLNTMAKFPQYSYNNNLLIMLQKPDATLCQSYTGWKKMGRFVKRGEKGIRILAPTPFKIDREQNKLDEKGQTILDKDGEPVKEKVQIDMTGFKPVSTFDLSQTEGEPLPTLGVEELTGSVEGYAKLFEAIKEASPVSVAFENIKGGAKGYFQTSENRIAIKEGMSEVQNVKTLIHEMAHAKLHNMTAQKARDDGGQTRSSKEVEAESVAYTVCQHYGIDTSDYSFAYVAGWSKGKEMPELKESLGTIQKAASELITAIDEKVQELTVGKEQVSFYVAECSEFHSMGEFKEGLKLPEAVELYQEIPADRMNRIKAIGISIKDADGFSHEWALVRGGKLQFEEMKEIVPQMAENPSVQKAAEEIQDLMPELRQESVERGGTEKESVHAKLEAVKEKAAAQPRKEVKAKNKGQEI
jgi:antirestriction protein ArdC